MLPRLASYWCVSWYSDEFVKTSLGCKVQYIPGAISLGDLMKNAIKVKTRYGKSECCAGRNVYHMVVSVALIQVEL